ncbi:MAG: DUF2769 domain-containing protein [Promethearchaeota archaeon]
MPLTVPNTEESVTECRKFCRFCPSLKLNQLNEFEPHLLFCSRGKTIKPRDQLKSKGCNCFGCGLFSKYQLEKGFFCMPWEQK